VSKKIVLVVIPNEFTFISGVKLSALNILYAVAPATEFQEILTLSEKSPLDAVNPLGADSFFHPVIPELFVL
jgi:hypothetical protein